MGREKDEKAIYLGTYVANPLEGGGQDTRRPVMYRGGKHMLTVGPTGVGLLIANLSHLQRSVIVIDPKGEAAAITARKRAKMGRVVMLNPFQLLADKLPWMKSDGFNPLLRLPDKSSPGFNVEASKLAETLAPIEAMGDNKHFDESAQHVLAAYIMAELVEAREAGRQPSFERVRENIAKPGNEYCLGLKDNPAMPAAVKNKVADLDG